MYTYVIWVVCVRFGCVWIHVRHVVVIGRNNRVWLARDSGVWSKDTLMWAVRMWCACARVCVFFAITKRKCNHRGGKCTVEKCEVIIFVLLVLICFPCIHTSMFVININLEKSTSALTVPLKIMIVMWFLHFFFFAGMWFLHKDVIVLLNLSRLRFDYVSVNAIFVRFYIKIRVKTNHFFSFSFLHVMSLRLRLS